MDGQDSFALFITHSHVRRIEPAPVKSSDNHVDSLYRGAGGEILNAHRT